ncbi:MAG: hypothetical protein GY925_16730 [Actinomycetia bacterium]|nr:hypothetical protein [Actinomycetes bacterium]
MDELASRLLHNWALNAVAHAEALAVVDPTWGSEVHPVAGGWLVLSGAGMYVNRAMAVGLDSGLSASDLELIIERSTSRGVSAAIEVTPATHQATIDTLLANGFVHTAEHDVTALTRPVPGRPIDAPERIVRQRVKNPTDLRLWQNTTAIGWGHTDPAKRRASNAFSLAAHAVDGELMVLALDPAHNEPVGCATTTIRDRLATLGGMSTVHTRRRQGVQAALIDYRLELAARHGCDLAATSAVTGGPSERNLIRHGFTPLFVVETYESPLPT